MLMNAHVNGTMYGNYEFNCVFLWICVKVWNPNDISSLQKHVAITLSLLQKKFLATFFDVMTHLLLHVVDELDVFSGEDDEGSKRLCLFHGMTLRY